MVFGVWEVANGSPANDAASGASQIVRSFGEQWTDFGNATATWTIPARPHQILDIYRAEPRKAQVHGDPLKTSPEMVVCRTTES